MKIDFWLWSETFIVSAELDGISSLVRHPWLYKRLIYSFYKLIETFKFVKRSKWSFWKNYSQFLQQWMQHTHNTPDCQSFARWKFAPNATTWLPRGWPTESSTPKSASKSEGTAFATMYNSQSTDTFEQLFFQPCTFLYKLKKGNKVCCSNKWILFKKSFIVLLLWIWTETICGSVFVDEDVVARNLG